MIPPNPSRSRLQQPAYSFGIAPSLMIPGFLKSIPSRSRSTREYNSVCLDIPIPNAWTLVGVADIHRFLKEGQIFACVKPVDSPAIYLEGPVLISRSPTVHPGDAQIVQAIGRPPEGSCFAHESLPNTVVFSVQGRVQYLILSAVLFLSL